MRRLYFKFQFVDPLNKRVIANQCAHWCGNPLEIGARKALSWGEGGPQSGGCGMAQPKTLEQVPSVAVNERYLPAFHIRPHMRSATFSPGEGIAALCAAVIKRLDKPEILLANSAKKGYSKENQ